MGRYTGTPPATPNITQDVPIGAVAPVFRSGGNYKAVGESILRSQYSVLDAAFPRNGSFQSSAASLAAANVRDVAYGAGVFVAVTGTSAATSKAVGYSPDGVNWFLSELPAAKEWTTVVFGAGLFVAIAWTGEVATSPDGVVWTAQTSLTGGGWTASAFNGTVFVAIGTGTQAASSTNGTSWTARTLPSSASWNNLAYGAGLFVANSNVGTFGATSPDGVTWTARTMPSDAWYSMAYGAGVFVAIKSGGVIATSTDGIAWTLRSLGHTVGGSGQVVIFGNGVFNCSTPAKPGSVMVSYDGISWQQKSTPLTNQPSCGGYGAGVTVLFATATSSPSAGAAIHAENLTDSTYLYIAGNAGDFVRVK